MIRRRPSSIRTDTLCPYPSLFRSDIHKTIQNLGGRVETEDTLLTDPDQTGSLFVDGADKFKIIVPAHTSPERDRFTIAHEFGHFVLHYLWMKQKKAFC